MNKANKPPRQIKENDIVFAKINNKVEKCKVISTIPSLILSTLKDIEEVQNDYDSDNYFLGETPKKYHFKFWKYGIDFALTKEELL